MMSGLFYDFRHALEYSDENELETNLNHRTDFFLFPRAPVGAKN